MDHSCILMHANISLQSSSHLQNTSDRIQLLIKSLRFIMVKVKCACCGKKGDTGVGIGQSLISFLNGRRALLGEGALEGVVIVRSECIRNLRREATRKSENIHIRQNYHQVKLFQCF